MKLSKSIFLILGSTLLISGSSFALLKIYHKKLNSRLANTDYTISLVIQTGPEKCPLSTHYLCELMSLSRDKPRNIYEFSIKQAEKRLLASPLIKKAVVSPVKPSAVYVDYTARVPIAQLGEYPNYAVDDEGAIFPIEPFLSAKNLPKLILGKPLESNQKIDVSLACNIIQFCQKWSLNVERIDLKDIHASSIGRRQLILKVNKHLLRLTPKNYRNELDNYIELCKSFTDDKEKIIDFRLENKAYVSDK